MSRIRVGVLFGGESAEHEVSLQSAINVMEAMDREKYEVVPIGIDRAGRWHLPGSSRFLADPEDPERIRLEAGGRSLTLMPGGRREALLALSAAPGEEGPDDAGAGNAPVDVVFPVLHGPLGEDGSVQGLLRLAHLPFVGAGVLGSAVGMDKDVTKRLLRDAGIPTARFRVLLRGEGAPPYTDLAASLGVPFFVKPANLGSSVGVHKVRDEEEYAAAVEDAFSYDRKLLAEEFVEGREIECAVLGNDEPAASVPGEIVARHDFYSYEAKYLDEEGADLEIPADLSPETSARVRELAVRTFRTLCCEGMARVDFFLRPAGEILVNELNSIPGFTRISMYPKLWEATGIGYAELIDRLIELALERHREESRLRSWRISGPETAEAGEGCPDH